MKRLIVMSLLLCTAFAWGDAPKEKEPVRKIAFSRMHAAIQGAADTFEIAQLFHTTQVHGMCIQLDDGSFWEVEEMGPESLYFYQQRKPVMEFDFVEDITKTWSPGDKLYFIQRAPKKEEFLVYNATRKHLFDATPMHPPVEPSLTLSALDLEKGQIKLSDGSEWTFKGKFAPEYEWKVGDPILIAFENPWLKTAANAPYVLVNMCACRCDATVKHIHPNRQPAWRVE